MAQHRFLFELPLEFFAQLVPHGCPVAAQDDAQSPVPQADPASVGDVAHGPDATHTDNPLGSSRPVQPWSEAGSTCIACAIGVNGPGFASAAEQRAHYKTDWHRYNVKRRLEKAAPIEESAFEALLAGDHDVSSISGSGSSDSSSDEDEAPRSKAPLLATGRVPQALFQAPDGKLYAVWRSLLLADQNKHGHLTGGEALAALRALRCRPAPLWALLMLRGGHFAAAVFRLRDVSGVRKGHAQEAYEVVGHKTFHRYVVRAKAGGKQSAKDGSGKFARSAGARLRRHNETALQRDMAQLFADWRSLLASTDLLFVSAPSSNMQSLLAASAASVGMQPTSSSSGNGAAAPAEAGDAAAAEARATALRPAGAGGPLQPPLISGDPRVRRVPFITQRPTASELKRVVRLLGSVYEVEPLPQEKVADEQLVVARQQQQQQQQQSAVNAATALAAMTVDVTAPGAREASSDGADGAASHKQLVQEEAPLIKAARAGDAARVARLLDSGHDPTVTDARGRTPYALAANKEVRDALRRFMAAHLDDWDYGAAGIPSALTTELEAEQAVKKADKRARQKAREAERKAEERRRREAAAAAELAALEGEIARAAAEAMTTTGTARPSSSGRGASSESGRGRGSAAGRGRGPAGADRPLTPEEAARRREVMAAAAEARMKALQAAAQQQQLW